MKAGRFRILIYPVWPTILALMVGAAFGALWAVLLGFLAGSLAISLSGIFGWMLYGPILMATAGISAALAVVLVPLWAGAGGKLFAARSSGVSGTTAKRLRLNHFSDTHPISVKARAMTDRLQMPPLKYIGWYDAPDINAFAMGLSEDDALVAFSRGAVEKLTKEQLDAVLGHEIGHISNNDMARMTYAQGVREALSFFLVFRGVKNFVRWVFTPFSELELLRFSRAREFTADAIAAHLASPEAIISVLEKLQGQSMKPQTYQQAPMMLSAAFSRNWFSTHPPLEDRIAALRDPEKNGSRHAGYVSF